MINSDKQTKICTACYWKKQFSVFHQDNSKDDFTGKDVGKGKTRTTMEDCKRCNGTGLEPVYVPEVKSDEQAGAKIDYCEFKWPEWIDQISVKLNECIDAINLLINNQ